MAAYTNTIIDQTALFDEQMMATVAAYDSKAPLPPLVRNPYLRRLDAFTREALQNPVHTLASLFCGGGGLDLGLSFAGFGTRVCSDVAPVFVDTVVHNVPHAVGLPGNAMDLTGAQLVAAAGTETLDLVAAGPPCQAFSILGRRGALDDPRGMLALKYMELVAEIKPRAFLFENVPGLLTVNGGADWTRLREYARQVTGYHLHWKKLNSASFGIPQYRERVVLVGFREDTPFEFPTVPTGPGATELMIEGQLATPSAWALEALDGLPNHNIRLHGDRVTKRYNIIPQGGRDATDHTDRIHPLRPSGTVLVGSSAGGEDHIFTHSSRE
ncbi:MAG: DNA cytosine methyltransferase [Janthinobacterium lividum]